MSYLRRRHHVPGLSPGTYDTPQTREVAAPDVTVLDFSADGSIERSGIGTLDRDLEGTARWVIISGRPNLDVLEALRDRLELDPLVLEDIVSQGERPKLTDLETHVLVTLSVPDADEPAQFRQLSLCLVGRTLVSIYDGNADFVAPVRRRIDQSATFRERGAPYLLYAIIDLAVDVLFPSIEAIGDRLETLETTIIEKPEPSLIAEVHEVRRALVVFRQAAWATRDVIGDVRRHFADEDAGRIRMYLQDAQDHIVTIIDIVEMQRDLATTLVELNMSMMSHRLNDVMKVLTVIATLFIPPTFITGIYGMNFDRAAGPLSMPELGWPLGYVSVITVMLLLMLGMLAYFKRKHWF